MASAKPADLRKKVKTALDETRLLILGAQVLFGFQLNGVSRKLSPDFRTVLACSIAPVSS